jgi:hypothetical protein
MSTAWLKQWQQKHDLLVREPIKSARWRYGTRAVVVRWSERMKGILQWAHPAFIFDMDEVMVFASRNRRIMCLTDHPVPRIQDPKHMQITVALCISALGHAAPPLIVIPLLKSCMRAFRALHKG